MDTLVDDIVALSYHLEPFHSRLSDMFGHVTLWCPEGEPSTWASKPWVVQTEKGPDGPIEHEVNGKYAMEAFTRPHFIASTSLWHYTG